jgi:hypothetical protein
MSITGSLVHLSTTVRPDVSFAVGMLCRVNSKPTEESLTAAKHILRYLKSTVHTGITYQQSDLFNAKGEVVISGFCDADWAGDTLTRKSTSGYVLLMGGGPIAWQSRRQRIVALSSVESEYIAVSECGREVDFVLQLLHSLSIPVQLPITISIDSTGAESVANSGKLSRRTKHIDVRAHHIRSMISDGKIVLEHVDTKLNTADVFTKALARPLFTTHAQKIVSVCK